MNPYEIWIADFGFIGKVRPVLILTTLQENDARGLVIVLPLISQVRGLRGEFSIGKPKWLPKASVINIQGIASLATSKLMRKMGTLSDAQMTKLKQEVRAYLRL